MSNELVILEEKELEALADDLIRRVDEGELDPIKVYTQAKHMEAFVKKINGAIKHQTVNEATKYGKSFQMYGYRIDVKNTADTYDYSFDSEYRELASKLAERKATLDLAIKQNPNELVINGEVIPVCPVKTYGGETIALTKLK